MKVTDVLTNINYLSDGDPLDPSTWTYLQLNNTSNIQIAMGPHNTPPSSGTTTPELISLITSDYTNKCQLYPYYPDTSATTFFTSSTLGVAVDGSNNIVLVQLPNTT